LAPVQIFVLNTGEWVVNQEKVVVFIFLSEKFEQADFTRFSGQKPSELGWCEN
jgi:hypothetical protein